MESDKIQKQAAFTPLRVATEKLLSIALDSEIEIEEIECLTEKGRRNMLLRCFIEPIEDFPSSFIIKKVETDNYNPDDIDSPDIKRFFNEWIGTQFLNRISNQYQHSPRFYGGNRDLGMIVIEDVRHQNRLVEPLLGSERDRGNWALLQYATCLARLHRDTLNKAEEFEKLTLAVSPKMQFPQITIDLDWHQSMLEKIGINPESNWLSEIKTILDTLNHPDRFLTYIHTEACPDNVLDTGEELRLIDFETGRFGHALIDAACGRMMFPSCWCSKGIPLDLVRQMENTYRGILIERCSAAEDDLIFEKALVSACGFWLLYTLSRHLNSALEKDEDFGISTIRQRILARLSVFITTSQEFNRFPALRGTSSKLLAELSQRWSNVPALPLYPAFIDSQT